MVTHYLVLLACSLLLITFNEAQVAPGQPIKLGAPTPIPVDDENLVSVMDQSARTLFSSYLGGESSSSRRYRLGKIFQATRQVVAGFIYFARFELLEMECPSESGEDSACKEKAKRLCSVSIWKKLNNQEVDVKDLHCDQ